MNDGIKKDFEEMVQDRRYHIDLLTPGVYHLFGLSNEVGELQSLVKKIERDGDHIVTEKDRREIVDELGDCLWYLLAYAQSLGISLDEIMAFNINKLKGRPKKGSLS